MQCIVPVGRGEVGEVGGGVFKLIRSIAKGILWSPFRSS